MAIRLPGKSLAQSLIPAASHILAWPSTDTLLSGASAFISSLRGLGWSPLLHHEARTAAGWVNSERDFVVIDAGANVGSWTAAFRKYATGHGRIYAFEPQPQAAEKIRGLHVEGCEVVEAALGRQAGTLAFYTSSSTDTMASLYERRDTYSMRRDHVRYEVKVIRLDDFVQTNRIDKIDFIKMDLEGAELEALHGASECLQTGLLKALSFEFGISDINSRVYFRDFFYLLSERSYALFRMTPARRLIRVREYTEDLEIFARTTTYFAKHI
jgi:FkbM family methyltransferase